MSVHLHINHASAVSSTSILASTECPLEISLNITNRCLGLTHLVIYDYKKWLETEEDSLDDGALFSLDSKFDNMSSASDYMQTALESELYLVRASFEDSEELEGIVRIPDNDAAFNLIIEEIDDARSLSTWEPVKFLTPAAANTVLNSLQG